MDSQDSRFLLARRLRALREDHWPDRKVTQTELARALGGVSVPLVSSWESQANPRIPPLPRLEAYAVLFATARSFDGEVLGLIDVEDMSQAERQAMTELRRDLIYLRRAAMQAGSAPAEPTQARESLGAGPWRFDDGSSITVVCSQWPASMLEKVPYTDIDDPGYVEMLTYSELDALFEMHGHLRAANPVSNIYVRAAGNLVSDDYASHLVSLGGLDWSSGTSPALRMIDLPVRQVADLDTSGNQYFEVDEGGKTIQHRPILEKSRDRDVLREDVALFARMVNPFNRKRTLTICDGTYSRGTYGVVRALTDARFRDRNAEYLQERFGRRDTYCILTRVPVVNGATLTPDWTTGDFTLFEWAA